MYRICFVTRLAFFIQMEMSLHLHTSMKRKIHSQYGSKFGRCLDSWSFVHVSLLDWPYRKTYRMVLPCIIWRPEKPPFMVHCHWTLWIPSEDWGWLYRITEFYVWKYRWCGPIEICTSSLGFIQKGAKKKRYSGPQNRDYSSLCSEQVKNISENM